MVHIPNITTHLVCFFLAESLALSPKTEYTKHRGRTALSAQRFGAATPNQRSKHTHHWRSLSLPLSLSPVLLRVLRAFYFLSCLICLFLLPTRDTRRGGDRQADPGTTTNNNILGKKKTRTQSTPVRIASRVETSVIALQPTQHSTPEKMVGPSTSKGPAVRERRVLHA